MDTSFDPTLESDIKELLKEVPPPIRAFFASGKVETVAKNLMQKNKLHIDQGAVVEREIILLLLGLKDPAEFVKILSEEAKLDAQTVNSIVQDINAQIFIPLREEEMKSGGTKTPPAPGLPKLIPAQKPGSTPQSHFHLQNKIAPPSPPAPPTPPKPTEGRKLLEDHEEPHIEFKKAPTPPPQNLPGAIHHPPLPAPKPILPTVPPAPIKSYSSDPYREPIDEK